MRISGGGNHEHSSPEQCPANPVWHVDSVFQSLFHSRRTPTAILRQVPPMCCRFGMGLPRRCRGTRGQVERGSAMNPLEGELSDRDIQILNNLERFRLLTTRQIQRLFFAPIPYGTHTSQSAATRSTTRVLNRLESQGYIARLERRIGGVNHGSALITWQLAAAGDSYLRQLYGAASRRRFQEPGLAFMRHTLAVAEVGVALEEADAEGRLELLKLELEPACWRTFQVGASSLTLKPDLAVVTADSTTETHSFVEVDLCTEHRPVLQRKCQVYQRYHQTGDEQEATGLFPAVVWIAHTPARARTIRDAIRSDSTLDHTLFWVCTTETMLNQLAPYNSEPIPNRKE
ncbi:replication-relaxation family protein [Leucobacter aridicollis]|uniref:replication-relaxation family protein n=1 Tax=Leucobacter aridicollis TaxID=283878 RepID=UPI0035B664EA|nr:hypothetical protein [Leucobacter aridicollis]